MSTVDQLAKYQPYPDYKDSGVEWLDAIPAEWDILRIDSVAEYVRESKTPSWLSNKTVVHYSIPSIQEFGVGQIEDGGELDSNKLLVEPGDLLVSKLNPRKGTICRVQQHEQPIVASTEFIALRTSSVNSKYFEYLFKSQELSGFICSQVESATRSHQRVNPVVIYKSKLLYPCIAERKKIISFLDYETARIDQLIAKQQQLIELLKEKRQAVISHAVTKGLNPNATMKDSGVEWLGQVPEHWVVSRIKNYAKIESGHTPSRQVEAYWENCTIPWVSLNDSKTLKEVDYISDTYYQISELGMANSSAHLLPEKAVVFTRDASIGLSAITTKPMAVSQHLIAWICKEEKVIPEYLLLVFYAMEKEFERYTFGATIKTIGMDDVRSLTAAFPDIDEQKKLISWAFTKLEKLKSALQKAESTIALLQERRTALISAAVTGKIDLRGWQPPKSEVAA